MTTTTQTAPATYTVMRRQTGTTSGPAYRVTSKDSLSEAHGWALEQGDRSYYVVISTTCHCGATVELMADGGDGPRHYIGRCRLGHRSEQRA